MRCVNKSGRLTGAKVQNEFWRLVQYQQNKRKQAPEVSTNHRVLDKVMCGVMQNSVSCIRGVTKLGPQLLMNRAVLDIESCAKAVASKQEILREHPA